MEGMDEYETQSWHTLFASVICIFINLMMGIWAGFDSGNGWLLSNFYKWFSYFNCGPLLIIFMKPPFDSLVEFVGTSVLVGLIALYIAIDRRFIQIPYIGTLIVAWFVSGYIIMFIAIAGLAGATH